jgi:hypothetical protein
MGGCDVARGAASPVARAVASSRSGIRHRAGRTGLAARGTGGGEEAVPAAQVGLITLLDARPDLDAGALADQYAVRILRGFGLGRSEAARLASRPLPDVANLA